MTLQEFKETVSCMSAQDLKTFTSWFEEFLADAWDRQIEEDAKAGRLDEAMQRAKDDFDSGRCTPL